MIPSNKAVIFAAGILVGMYVVPKVRSVAGI